VNGTQLTGGRPLVASHIQGPTPGFPGELRVNVPTLNIALDQKFPPGH
jgi:K+-transporting ATPase c subunit